MALVFSTDPRERPLHDELVAALADVFALPAVDVPLDLIHLLDGQMFALHLLTVEAARRLAERHDTDDQSGDNARKTGLSIQSPFNHCDELILILPSHTIT